MKYKTVRIPVMEKDERELEWVYFIVSDEIKKTDNEYSYSTGHSSMQRRIKIGMSKNEDGVIKRFQSISQNSPSNVYMLGYIQGYEKDWHRYFQKYRIKGEWFAYDPIKEIIMGIKLKVPEDTLNKFRENYLASYRPRNASYTSNKPGPEWDAYFKEEKRTKNVFSLTREYRRSIFKEDSLSDIYRRESWNIEQEKKDYNFLTEHCDKIVKVLNAFNFGDLFIGDLPFGEVIITESKTTKLDIFNDVIHPGEIYYRTGNYGTGLSVRSGHRIYECFDKFIRSRKYKRGNFNYNIKQDSEYAKKHYSPKETELLERKEMFENELESIKKELGIIYYNDAATNWIDKEQEALIRRYEKEGSDSTSMFAGYRIY